MPTCCFCLGDETDIPPFGTVADSSDFVSPCTCSVECHRKCLNEWFSSLPADKLQVVESSEGEQSSLLRWAVNLTIPGSVEELAVSLGRDGPAGDEDVRERRRSVGRNFANVAWVIAPCPQCKQDIVFSMRRLGVLSFVGNVQLALKQVLQYGAFSFAVTAAATGIVSVGYLSLTSCGIKMMERMVPGPLLVQMLTRNGPTAMRLPTKNLMQMIFGNVNDLVIDNLEQAVVKGLVDPFKFLRIPVLPILLYKMRSSSILSCFTSLEGFVAELMIDAYISSLGDHLLVRELANKRWRDIDIWKTPNIIGMLVPLRWLYDVFFRFTFNQAHFLLCLSARPRVISNTLPLHDVDRLEELNNERGMLIASYSSLWAQIVEKHPNRLRQRIVLVQSLTKQNLMWNYWRCCVKSWYYRFKACLVHDYSSTLLSNSKTVRMVTTVMWPFVASSIGSGVVSWVAKLLPDLLPEKQLLVSNIAGLVAAVIAKDLVNLYFSYKKAQQLSIVCIERERKKEEKEEEGQQPEGLLSWFRVPGSYPE